MPARASAPTPTPARLTPVVGSAAVCGAGGRGAFAFRRGVAAGRGALALTSVLGLAGMVAGAGITTCRGVGWQLPVAVPSTATEFPQTLIGIVIGIEIWLPLATLLAPEVLELAADEAALLAESLLLELLPAVPTVAPPGH